jgi:hypothetical protein
MSSNYGGRAGNAIDKQMQTMQRQRETAEMLDREMNAQQVPGGFVKEGIALDLMDRITPRVEGVPPVGEGKRKADWNNQPIQVGDLPEAPPFRPMKSVMKRGVLDDLQDRR